MLPEKVSNNNLLVKVSSSLFASNNDEEIDFVIVLDNEDISLRDFGNYLLLIDHFYGRMFKRGFLSYSLSEREHIRAATIRSGSIEITLEDILKYLPHQNAVLLFLLIKFLPAALKTISEAALNLSNSLYTYEKSRLTKEVRKNLRQSIKDDAALSELSDSEISKLAERLQKKYDQDRKLLSRASKFSKEKFKSIQVRRRNK